MNECMASYSSVIASVVVYKQYRLDLSAPLEIRQQGGWKSTMTTNGELCAMTGSTTMKPKLPAECLDLGIFSVYV